VEEHDRDRQRKLLAVEIEVDVGAAGRRDEEEEERQLGHAGEADRKVGVKEQREAGGREQAVQHRQPVGRARRALQSDDGHRRAAHGGDGEEDKGG